MIEVTYSDGRVVKSPFEGTLEEFIEWKGDLPEPVSLKEAVKVEVKQ